MASVEDLANKKTFILGNFFLHCPLYRFLSLRFCFCFAADVVIVLIDSSNADTMAYAAKILRGCVHGCFSVRFLISSFCRLFFILRLPSHMPAIVIDNQMGSGQTLTAEEAVLFALFPKLSLPIEFTGFLCVCVCVCIAEEPASV